MLLEKGTVLFSKNAVAIRPGVVYNKCIKNYERKLKEWIEKRK